MRSNTSYCIGFYQGCIKIRMNGAKSNKRSLNFISSQNIIGYVRFARPTNSEHTILGASPREFAQGGEMGIIPES